jgi:hypothetical protein
VGGWGADKRWVGGIFFDLDSQNRDKRLDERWIEVALRLVSTVVSPTFHAHLIGCHISRSGLFA